MGVYFLSGCAMPIAGEMESNLMFPNCQQRAIKQRKSIVGTSFIRRFKWMDSSSLIELNVSIRILNAHRSKIRKSSGLDLISFKKSWLCRSWCRRIIECKCSFCCHFVFPQRPCDLTRACVVRRLLGHVTALPTWLNSRNLFRMAYCHSNADCRCALQRKPWQIDRSGHQLKHNICHVCCSEQTYWYHANSRWKIYIFWERDIRKSINGRHERFCAYCYHMWFSYDLLLFLISLCQICGEFFVYYLHVANNSYHMVLIPFVLFSQPVNMASAHPGTYSDYMFSPECPWQHAVYICRKDPWRVSGREKW